MTKKYLQLILALANVKHGNAEQKDFSIIEESFEEIPDSILEEIKEKIPWGLIVLHDYGENTNERIGDYLFSLRDKKFDSCRYTWISQTIARKYVISTDIARNILKRNDENEVRLLFSCKEIVDEDGFNCYHDMIEFHIMACEKNGTKQFFDILATIPDLRVRVLKDYRDDFDWEIVSKYHILNEEFIFTFYDKLDIKIIEKRIEKMED